MDDFAIGQPVAIYWSDGGDGCADRTTIERDTNLYWIADGRKFRKTDGLEPGSTSNWRHGKYLLPLSDPRVTTAAIAARKSRAFGNILSAQAELSKDRENLAVIEKVKAALDAYAETLT